MTRAAKNVQILSDTETIRRYTDQAPGSGVDHYTSFRTMFDELISSGKRKRIYIPFGDWYLGTPLVLTPADGSSLRDFTLFGDGGNNTQPGTRLYFTASGAGVNAGLQITSGYNVSIEDMVLRITNPIKSILHVTAADAPALSGTFFKFTRVQFAPAGTTSPTEASVKIDNVKLAEFEHCWFSVGSTADMTALRVGGAIADFPSTLQQGVVHNCSIRQSFFFGRLAPRNVKQLDVLDTVFGESEYAIIAPDGDKRWQAGSVKNTCFVGDSNQNAITLGDYDPGTSTGEAAGQILIEGCEFRDRKVGVNVGAKGRCTINRNEFFIRRAGDKGVVIPSTATDVAIGPNNFDLAYRNGCVAVDDQRLTTSKMTNIGQALFAASHLTADYTPSTTNFERVINVSGLNFRGGVAWISYHAQIRNGATAAQRVRVKVQQTMHDATVVNLPMASSVSLATSSDGVVSGHGYVYLTPDTTEGDADCAISLWVQFETSADGFVRGAADNNTLGHTWLQCKEA